MSSETPATGPSASLSRTSSTSSATSTASGSGSTMQIFVKNIAGETVPLTVSSSITISHLKTLIPLPKTSTGSPAQTSPAKLRLVHAGHHLPAASTLEALNIQPNSTLNVIVPMLGGAPKRPKCQFKECKEKAQPIVGDCGFCKGHFCSKHRMLESHLCEGLESARQQEKKRNQEQLEKERTRPQAAV